MRIPRSHLGTRFILGLALPVVCLGCAQPGFPARGAAPATPPPSEYVPRYEVPVGTLLRYQGRSAASGSVPGRTIPEVRQTVIESHQVLSLDREGVSTVRVDMNGQPSSLVRIRRDGSILDMQALTPQGTAEAEAWAVAMQHLRMDRPVRVGDAVPFRVPLPNAPDIFQGTEFVGNLILTQFSPMGRCWSADFQGATRLSVPGDELNDPKTHTRFRVQMVGEVRERHEVRTGVMVGGQATMSLDLLEAGSQPAARGRLTLTYSYDLDARSRQALGCE